MRQDDTLHRRCRLASRGTVTAITSVEIALWDLAGKFLGAPGYQLLGGKFREGPRAYWTLDPKDMLDPASCLGSRPI